MVIYLELRRDIDIPSTKKEEDHNKRMGQYVLCIYLLT